MIIFFLYYTIIKTQQQLILIDNRQNKKSGKTYIQETTDGINDLSICTSIGYVEALLISGPDKVIF